MVAVTGNDSQPYTLNDNDLNTTNSEIIIVIDYGQTYAHIIGKWM